MAWFRFLNSLPWVEQVGGQDALNLLPFFGLGTSFSPSSQQVAAERTCILGLLAWPSHPADHCPETPGEQRGATLSSGVGARKKKVYVSLGSGLIHFLGPAWPMLVFGCMPSSGFYGSLSHFII